MEFQPRFFWRRLAALIVDYIVVLLVTTVVLAPIVIGSTDKVRFTAGGLNFTKCFTSNTAPQALVDIAGGIEIDRLMICDKSMLGLYNGRWATLERTTSEPEAKYRTTRRITVPVNHNGDPVEPLLIQDVLIAVVFLFLTPLVLARWSGQTPGRRLLKIRVQTFSLTYAVMAKRELLKWGPFAVAVLSAYYLAPQTLAAAEGEGFIWLIALAAGPSLIAVFWWLIPLFFWRGAMPYDRICDASVTYDQQ